MSGPRGAARTGLLAAVVTGVATLVVGCTSSGTDAGPASTSPVAPSGSSPGTGSGTTSAKPTPRPTGTVPSIKVPTKSPVPIPSPAPFGTGVVARITAVRAVQGHPNGPGEVAGPAIAVYVTLRNDSGRPAAVTQVVNVFYGAANSPASPISGTPAQPFPSRLPAHSSVRGVYVYTVPVADRGHVVIEVSYTPRAPVVRFAGPVP